MKTHEWQPYLKILDIQEIDNFQPFKYVYAISQTQKAILFKLKTHLTSFVPKSVLRIDNHGVSPNGKKNWIWIHKNWIDKIIAEHANKKINI